MAKKTATHRVRSAKPPDIPGGLFPRQPYPSETWETFAAQFQGHPALEFETLYALPSLLIEEIGKQAPGVLTADDQHFELKLAQSAGTGFFMRRPFAYPLLMRGERAGAEDEPTNELRRRWQATEENLRQLEVQILRNNGYTDAKIDEHFKRNRLVQQQIEERRVGYAGWLTTNPEFRTAVISLRTKWAKKIEAYGGFPEASLSLMGEMPAQPAEPDREFYADWVFFYRHWGIETMATDELPVPLRPALNKPTLYAERHKSGVNLSIPLYLLRDQKIDLHAIAASEMDLADNRHLWDWLLPRKRYWGHIRFGTMLQIAIFFELALKQRYHARLRGNLDKLDHAFAAFLYKRGRKSKEELSVVESVKRIRLELTRRLNSASNS